MFTKIPKLSHAQKSELSLLIKHFLERSGRSSIKRNLITPEENLSYLKSNRNNQKFETRSYKDRTKDPLGNINYFDNLKNQLASSGVKLEESEINIVDFERFLLKFPELKKHYKNAGDVAVQKCLEHYLTYSFMELSNLDIFIDIAAADSPWAEILNRKNIRSFKLDRTYPDGINGIKIGADACYTNLPEKAFSALALQCAYECFMGDSDIQFFKEAGRILNAKGRVAIVPLYLDKEYVILSSPYCDQRKILVDPGAIKVWRDDEYKEPFSRHYSPEAFKNRIYSNVPKDMNAKVIYFKNIGELNKHYRGQRIYCFFMFYCEKTGKKSE